MTILGMTDAEIMNVWRIVSAVLYFGQMQFDTERRTDQAVLLSDTRMVFLFFAPKHLQLHRSSAIFLASTLPTLFAVCFAPRHFCLSAHSDGVDGYWQR